MCGNQNRLLGASKIGQMRLSALVKMFVSVTNLVEKEIPKQKKNELTSFSLQCGM